MTHGLVCGFLTFYEYYQVKFQFFKQQVTVIITCFHFPNFPSKVILPGQALNVFFVEQLQENHSYKNLCIHALP